MSASVLHPTPSWRAVLEEQFRAVGLLIRPAVAVVGALAAAMIVFVCLEAVRVGEGVPFDPELAFFTIPVAFLLPIAVWKGEYRFRHSYLAAMPVDRTHHVLAKIAAGWAWLMILVAAYLLLTLALTLVTGGEIGVGLRVLEGDVPPGASPEEVAALARRWTTPAWQWAVFVPGATAVYLIGTAILLAGRRTRRWLAGIALGCLFVVAVDETGGFFHEADGMIETALDFVFAGPYGLELLTAGRDSPVDLLSADGTHVVSVWRRPDAGQWLMTLLLWMALAVASVAGAVAGNRKD